jgi:hypothetical protein
MRSLVRLFCLALCLCTPSPTSAQPAVTVTLAHDSVVDPAAWNFPDGRYGTSVNGQTFQQEAVISHDGFQYAAFFADGGVLAIGRRKLPDGAWEVIRFGDYTARDHRDAHNVVSMGIADGDGTIHLMFDHHGDPLHYRRSVRGLASKPAEFMWKAEHFGPVTSTLDGANDVKGVTYPQMVSAPGGKLQVIYRIGSSGNGDWHLAEYDPAGAGRWTVLGMPLSRAGQYQSSPHRCAYPNPLRYDAQGRLHMTWCWRETAPQGHPFDLRTNHDLMYAFSEDAGRTWKNNAGQTIASLADGQSIGLDTPGVVVRQTKWLWGQMNTTTQCIDAKGRVHVINWQQPHHAKQGSKDLNTWHYVHYWRDETGTWQENPLPFVGRKPQVVLDSAGNAIVVYTKGVDANYHGKDPGGKLTVAVASASSRWSDWSTVHTVERVSVGEPLLDHRRWSAEGVLSVYLQDKPEQPGHASALRVLDFRVTGPNSP